MHQFLFHPILTCMKRYLIEMGKEIGLLSLRQEQIKILKYGNLIGHQNKMKILTILQRLDT